MDELVAKLVTASHNETMRVTELCAEARERAAFYEGFQRGEQEGRILERNAIQKALGITNCSMGAYTADSHFEDWKRKKAE